MKYLVLLVLSLILFTGCTEQMKARNFGGSTKVEIPANQRFVNITWKNDGNLWVLTRNRNFDELYRETYYFREKSNFGVWEGTVVIEEK